MNTETKPLNIYQKLLKVQQHINGLGKDKKTYSYTYVTGDKVLGAIKPIMNEVGLLLKQEILSIENVRHDYKTKQGDSKSEINSKVMMQFTWVDTETGEKDVNLFGANGQNDWDKGVGSALTYGERYFLLKYFHIATDEDDIDNPDRKPQEQAKASKQAPVARGQAQPVAEAAALDAEREQVTAKPESKYASARQKEEIVRLLNNSCIQNQEKTKMLLNINKMDEARAKVAINKLIATIEERTGKPVGMVPLKQGDPATPNQREFVQKLIKSHVFTDIEKDEAQALCENAKWSVGEAADYINQLEQDMKAREEAEKMAIA